MLTQCKLNVMLTSNVQQKIDFVFFIKNLNKKEYDMQNCAKRLHMLVES
jgi:hypothetical protein